HSVQVFRATTAHKAPHSHDPNAGQSTPRPLPLTIFSVLPADVSKSTRIDGLGDKAIFCPNETGIAMLHVLKGDILITIGIHGLSANAVLDSEKSMATKILANL